VEHLDEHSDELKPLVPWHMLILSADRLQRSWSSTFKAQASPI
jgi:hypothetical protein